MNTSRFPFVFILISVIWLTGCGGIWLHNDPMQEWTFRPFEGSKMPPYGHNQIDKAITDDYQDYIKTNRLELFESITGFFVNKEGQFAVAFKAYGPTDRDYGYHYFLIYNKDNKRIKIIKYDRIGLHGIM